MRCAAVRADSPVPVAMDETAAEPGAPGAGAADAICLKIARCGGISGLLRDAAAARTAGSEVYVASSLRRAARDRGGPARGGRAGRHAARAAVRARRRSGCFEGLDGVLAPRAGAIAVPAGPGLL